MGRSRSHHADFSINGDDSDHGVVHGHLRSFGCASTLFSETEESHIEGGRLPCHRGLGQYQSFLDYISLILILSNRSSLQPWLLPISSGCLLVGLVCLSNDLMLRRPRDF